MRLLRQVVAISTAMLQSRNRFRILMRREHDGNTYFEFEAVDSDVPVMISMLERAAQDLRKAYFGGGDARG